MAHCFVAFDRFRVSVQQEYASAYRFSRASHLNHFEQPDGDSLFVMREKQEWRIKSTT